MPLKTTYTKKLKHDESRIILDTRVKMTSQTIPFKYMDQTFHYDSSFAFHLGGNQGYGRIMLQMLIQRLELNKPDTILGLPLQHYTAEEITAGHEMIVAYISDKIRIDSYVYNNILRKFMLKTYAGYCHAQGKPVRGQNTRFNGSTAKKRNKLIKSLLAERKKRKEIFQNSLVKKDSEKKRKRKKKKVINTKHDNYRASSKPAKIIKPYKTGRRSMIRKKKQLDA